jgi:two-component system, response regulator PdtaR
MHGSSQKHTQLDRSLGAFSNAPVLIVEDEKIVAWDIEQTLRENGLTEIVSTPSLRGAHEFLEETEHFALVILDLKLEGGDGEALIGEFIARGIPVLVVTGYANFRHAHVPVLYKPFATGEFLQAVQSILLGRG